LKSGDKNFSDFPDNQLTKFHALYASWKIGTKIFYHLDSTQYGERMTSSTC